MATMAAVSSPKLSTSLIPSQSTGKPAQKLQHVPGRLAARKAVAPIASHSAEQSSSAVPRRQALIGLSALVAGGAMVPFVEEAQAADLIQLNQRAEFLKIVKPKLFAAVTANQELVPGILALALADAATYDPVTKTGGANGSIRFSEELNESGNAGLKKALSLLETVKTDIDASVKGGPISYADLIQFAGQAAVKRLFLDHAIAGCGGDAAKGLQVYQAYGSASQWGQFEKKLGRADATGPDPKPVPNFSKLSNEEIKDLFLGFGVKPRTLPTMAAFLGVDREVAEAKLAEDPELAPNVIRYQKSRGEITENTYEVDLINVYTKISSKGQPINTEAYTYAPPRVNLRL